ncbi:hypothetical protein ABIB58_002852 [Brevundimonas sp. UYEF29]
MSKHGVIGRLDPAACFFVRAKRKGRGQPGFDACVSASSEADAIAVVRMHGHTDAFQIAPTLKGPWREVAAA